MRLKHVALEVPDLEMAEAFYSVVFTMELVTREALGEDRVWRQAPAAVGWSEARACGVEFHMVAMRSDDLLVSLFSGRGCPTSTAHLGVVADESEIADVRQRLPHGTSIEVDQPAALTFVDLWGWRWQLTRPGFRGSGDIRGDWLLLDR